MIENHNEILELTFSNQGGIFGSATEYIDDIEEVVVRNGLLRRFMSDTSNGFTPAAEVAFSDLEKALSKVSNMIKAESR